MRILVEITHPAHVHFFKNAIWTWQGKGHKVIIASRDKDLTIDLLNYYGLEHSELSKARTGIFGLATELICRGRKLYDIVGRQRPDIMIAIAATFIAPVGKLAGIPVICFTDTENAKISNAIAFSLSGTIAVPDCFSLKRGKKYISYNGYHELAYLHPNHFSPDKTILELLNVSEDEKFVIMRFVSWGASHDVGHNGLSLASKRKAVQEFSKYARVFITSEKKMPEDLEKYRISIPPERIHDALYYATLLYGESATMASECAVLGTPAIYLDNAGRGYTAEQESKYDSVFNFTESIENQEYSIIKGIQLLQTKGIKDDWQRKKRRILKDKTDVTAFIVDLIENYSEVATKCAE